jgi:FkbM family methyltransferase
MYKRIFMQDIWTKLKTEEKPILLYGTGNGADKILDRLELLGIKVSGVFASDGFVRKRTFRGFEVMSFCEAREKFGDFLALLAFGSNRSEVLSNFKRISESVELKMADVPVYDNCVFDLSYAREHKSELERVYNLLADEKSKEVFRETVLFKIDGDIERLYSCETPEDEAFENILRLEENSSFLDLGAYNGDTVLDFVKRVGSFSHITAIEPDEKTFKKLIKNTEHLEIERINSAVGDRLGYLEFSDKTSRGSHLGEGRKINCITADSLGKSFDYIKFDVEGAEEKAIEGAKRLISEHRPKMLISAYHKNSDYFILPLKVLEYRDDYKIYMRHYPYVPAWDVNFYFV